MAPPLPTLSTTQFSTLLGAQGLSDLEKCPLKRLAQYDCVMRQALPLSGPRSRGSMSSSSSDDDSKSTPVPAPVQTAAQAGPKRLVCTEFQRYFRRCADVGRGPNVEVTALMGVRRETGEWDEMFGKEGG